MSHFPFRARDVLALAVDDEERPRKRLERQETAESSLERRDLAVDQEPLELGVAIKLSFLALGNKCLEPFDALLDLGKIREHAANPTSGNYRHGKRRGGIENRLARLMFPCDEQYRFPFLAEFFEKCLRVFEELRGLLQVKDLNAVLRAEDVGRGRGVPARARVCEMSSYVEKLRDDLVCSFFLLVFLGNCHRYQKQKPPKSGTESLSKAPVFGKSKEKAGAEC